MKSFGAGIFDHLNCHARLLICASWSLA